jgi:hemerythrin superfamily protein
MLLQADHRTVEDLFARFKKAKSSRDKGRIGARICKELKIHTQIEEKLFYPEARRHLDDEIMVDEAVVEHAHLKELVADLEAKSAGDKMYAADMKVLMDYVKHHVKEEERELFPKLRATEMDMEMVGGKMAAMKQRLTRGTNGNGNGRAHKLNGTGAARSKRRTTTRKRTTTRATSRRNARASRH